MFTYPILSLLITLHWVIPCYSYVSMIRAQTKQVNLRKDCCCVLFTEIENAPKLSVLVLPAWWAACPANAEHQVPPQTRLCTLPAVPWAQPLPPGQRQPRCAGAESVHLPSCRVSKGLVPRASTSANACNKKPGMPAQTGAEVATTLSEHWHRVLTFWLWWWHECASGCWSVDTEWQTALPLCLPEGWVHCATNETRTDFKTSLLFHNSSQL